MSQENKQEVKQEESKLEFNIFGSSSSVDCDVFVKVEKKSKTIEESHKLVGNLKKYLEKEMDEHQLKKTKLNIPSKRMWNYII